MFDKELKELGEHDPDELEKKSAEELEQLLFLATRRGKSLVVDYLLERGVNVDSEQAGMRPIHDAAFGGHLSILQKMIEKGALIDQWGTPIICGAIATHGRATPLQYAAIRGHAEVVKFLIEKGASLHVKDSRGCNLLHLTALAKFEDEKERAKLGQYLLEKGVDPNHKIPFSEEKCSSGVTPLKEGQTEEVSLLHASGVTPLHLAAKEGQWELVSLLLSKGGDPKAKCIDQLTPLHFACESQSLQCVKLLVEKGANLEAEDGFGRTPLFWALFEKAFPLVQYLVESGANIEVQDVEGFTPFLQALFEGDKRNAHYLIERGVNLHAVTTFGSTALHLASGGFKEDIIGKPALEEIALFLLEKGFDIYAKNEVGELPIHYAAYSSPSLVRLYLEKGVDPNQKDGRGVTPLFRAASLGRTKICKLLLEAGAFPNLADDQGNTPFFVATEGVIKSLPESLLHVESEVEKAGKPFRQVALDLLEFEIDIERKNVELTSPFFFAIFNGWSDVAKKLIERGVDVHKPNCNGETALNFAIKYKRTEIEKMIRKELEKEDPCSKKN